MRVKGQLRELPDGNMKEQCVRFVTIIALRGNMRCPVDIDACTLIFVCATRHKEVYNSGDYVPAAREFQRQLIILDLIHRWDYTLVFDGCPTNKCLNY